MSTLCARLQKLIFLMMTVHLLLTQTAFADGERPSGVDKPFGVDKPSGGDKPSGVDSLSANDIWEKQIQWLKDGGWEQGVYSFHDGKWVAESKAAPERRTPNKPHEPWKDDLYGWYETGQAAFNSGDKTKAEKIWSDAVAKVDNHTYTLTAKDISDQRLNWILSSLGRLYFEQDRYKDAKPLLERMVKLQHSDEDNPCEKLDLGKVYQKLGETDNARKLYQTLIDRSDNYIFKTEALVASAQLCESQKQYDQAEEFLKKAISISTEFTHEGACEEAYIGLAHLYCAQHKYDAVKRVLDDAIQAREGGYAPDESETHFRVPKYLVAFAHCYEEQGNIPQAEHYIKMSMYGYHFLPRACTQYADLMEKENKPAEAKLWRDRAKEAKVIDWRAGD